MQLREKKVGPYVVRELSMRDTMRILREFPAGEGDRDARAAAYLGASVSNGSGQPMGDAVLDVGATTYSMLMKAHSEVNEAPDFAPIEGDEGNV